MAANQRRPAQPRRRRPVRHRVTVAATATPTGRRRTTLTTRAALLGLVLSTLIVLLALPLRTYFSQRGDIAHLVQQQAQQRQRIAQLQQQTQRFNDPGYVEEQARQRLHFVLPGETDYVLVTPKAKPKPIPTD